MGLNAGSIPAYNEFEFSKYLMQVQQVFSTVDTVYNQQRKRVYTTLVDSTGKTHIEYTEYYYPLYTKRGVLEVQKGSTIDLQA